MVRLPHCAQGGVGDGGRLKNRLSQVLGEMAKPHYIDKTRVVASFIKGCL
jgi:hypothetical protein